MQACIPLRIPKLRQAALEILADLAEKHPDIVKKAALDCLPDSEEVYRFIAWATRFND